MQSINRTVINDTFLAINNQDLETVFRSVVGDKGPVRTLTPRRGGGVMFKAELPSFRQDIPELGGVLVPQLFLSNTNNGQRALSVGVGLFRFVCSNGLVIAFGDSMHAKIRHVNGPKANQFLDILPDILLAQVQRIQSGELFDTVLDALDVQVKDPIQVIGNLPVAKAVKDNAVELICNGLTRPEDNVHTAWGLYNVVNEMQRRRSRSDYSAYAKDVGLLDHVIALAEAA